MQIEIYKPLAGDSVQPVEWNYAELKRWLTDGLALYKGRVYDVGQIPEAKRDAADLRKLAAAIDEKRKDMKKRYLKPYEEFEKQAKELTGLINEQVEEIAAQIRAYDEDTKKHKRAEIEALYQQMFGELRGLVPFERVFNPRWLNATFKMGQIEAELQIRRVAIESSIKAIHELQMDQDAEQRILSIYLESFDLARALAEKNRIELEKARLREYMDKHQPRVYDAADPDAFKKAQPGDVIQFGGPGCVRPSDTAVPREALGYAADEEPELLTVDFRVHVTREQLAVLKAFLVENKIKYGRVPKE